MRRILLFRAMVCLLSSCSGREPESRYPVTAAAFDFADGSLRLTLELMISADGGGKSDMTPTCFVGRGDSFSSAMVDAAQSVGRDITFDHMAIAILGEGLEGSSLADAISFCAEIEGVTPALELVCAEDGGRLLTEAVKGGSALAYEITAALNSKASSAYTDGCRLADVSDRRLKELLWAIPKLALEAESKDQQQVKRVGLTIYTGDRILETLTGEQSLIWRMLEGYSVSGNVRFGETDFELAGARLADGHLTVTLRSGDAVMAGEAIARMRQQLTASKPSLFSTEALNEIDIEVVQSLW